MMKYNYYDSLHARLIGGINWPFDEYIKFESFCEKQMNHISFIVPLNSLRRHYFVWSLKELSHVLRILKSLASIFQIRRL